MPVIPRLNELECELLFLPEARGEVEGWALGAAVFAAEEPDVAGVDDGRVGFVAEGAGCGRRYCAHITWEADAQKVGAHLGFVKLLSGTRNSLNSIQGPESSL